MRDRHKVHALDPQGRDVLTQLLSDAIDRIQPKIDEIRGHFTAPVLRDWLMEGLRHPNAAFCGLIYIKDRGIVGAFLLTRNIEFLYSQDGRRIACAFRATSMDMEMTGLFDGHQVVLLPLKQE
jgi:hypothetical protein